MKRTYSEVNFRYIFEGAYKIIMYRKLYIFFIKLWIFLVYNYKYQGLLYLQIPPLNIW